MTHVLVIAGSDSSGGAGLTRDVETLAHFGVGTLCALTAATAQSDAAVTAVEVLPPPVVRAQIEAAFATGRVAAVKIGMLGTRAIVLEVAAALAAHPAVPAVLDPVLTSTSGAALLDAAGQSALCARLLPLATLITPNVPEAAALLGVMSASSGSQLLEQGEALLALGARAVLLKGGHFGSATVTDLLLVPGAPARRLSAPRISRDRRGTGCALASAITAGLAAGQDLPEACAHAKQYVTALLQRA
ncbi:MAG: hydroxymethylpyrimidine/phosphomethylpyrimidine kinase [Gammaproteobacteria bacterium]|nr:hydroxymethylpyrimidine/phosphomethylpyrimidine kinase [Gammaproteobacteria bacterium]